MTLWKGGVKMLHDKLLKFETLCKTHKLSNQTVDSIIKAMTRNDDNKILTSDEIINNLDIINNYLSNNIKLSQNDIINFLERL